MKKVIVVGGGASGLMAAYAAAAKGNDVLLIERNEKLGKKIYITGKGRCNVTNDVPPQEFLTHVVRNSRFLTRAVYACPPQSVKDLIESKGVRLKTERGNRVFPVSDHASDITKALTRACEDVGVEVHLNEKMLDFDIMDSTMSGITTDKARYECDALLVCTGGLSYPSTGSTGDGYRFARKAGHRIEEPTPSLTGVNLKGRDHVGMQGLSLKNVSLTARKGGKRLYEGFGELLFTHYGISGPIVLTFSAVAAREPLKEVSLSLDFKPALSEEMLAARLLRDFSAMKNKALRNALGALLPAKAIDFVLEKAGVSPLKQVNAVTREDRRALVRTIKNYSLQPVSLRGFEEAVVTCGGVDVSQINPATMESKLVKGLYFCGETLDVDAFTGGFNLQIAFSTGFAAGNSIE